jgi:anaerobic magnesium-protoporphyrin IX monomethyl ester cyclase
MLLINPAAAKFGGFLSRYVPVGIPVAIGYIAAYLEKHDIKCAVIDEEIYEVTPERLREAVRDLERPYIIGVSCLTAHVARGYQIAKMIKEVFTDSIVVFGGLHPSSLPEEALSTGHVDYVVRGEGEEVMLRLHRALRGNGDPTEIRGVSYVRDGQIINNPESPLIPDINDIPPFPYHLFEHAKYDRGFMTTSRGCPYRCSYCSQRLLTGMTYRYKTAENIIKELEILVDKYGQSQVAFYDDNFCLNARRVHQLCDMIIERNLHKRVKLSVQTRADNVLKHGGEELVEHMSRAGFTHMGFGLETGVQRLANLVRKDETIEDHLEVAQLCRRHGMDVTFFMIFGLPTETSEDRRTSFEVVKSAKLQATKYNNLIPYPGTPLFAELKNSNRVVKTKDWGNFNSVLAITSSIFDRTPLPYVPETCSEWQLKAEITRYNLMSYVNAKSIAAIFGHTKGTGFIMLPPKWYLRPREIYEMAKVGLQLAINIFMAILPIRLTEPLMIALNPALGTRRRIEGYDPSTYQEIDWDKAKSKQTTVLLKTARDERRQTGTFNLNVAKEPALQNPGNR